MVTPVTCTTPAFSRSKTETFETAAEAELKQTAYAVSSAPHGYVFDDYLSFDLNENSISVWCG